MAGIQIRKVAFCHYFTSNPDLSVITMSTMFSVSLYA